MMRFRRGLTVHDRNKYRAEVLQREQDRAWLRASEHRLTDSCRRAMGVMQEDPALSRELHHACRGEEYPDGAGCLCLCHDEYPAGGVVTGFAVPG